MLTHVANFCRDEAGGTAIEYGLTTALVSVAVIAAFSQLGKEVRSMFTFVSDTLSAVVTTLPS